MTTQTVSSSIMRFLHALKDFFKGIFSDHSHGPRCC